MKTFHSKIIFVLLMVVEICQSAALKAEILSTALESSALEVRSPIIPETGIALSSVALDVSFRPRDSGNVAKAVAFGAIGTKITEAICTAGPALGPIGAGGCIAAGILTIVGTFFLFFQKDSGKRDLLTNYGIYTLDYFPTETCSIACMLHTTAPEGGWRGIGNFTIDNKFHEIHFSRNGSTLGLRSIQSSISDLVSREDVANDGGVVVDYMWENNNIAAYDSFGSSSGQEYADSNYFEQTLANYGGLIECAGWRDNNGLLANGLLAVGWNNREYQWQDGESQVYLDRCGNMLKNA